MRQRIENFVKVSCKGLDLTTITDIELTIKQGTLLELVYYPTVIDESTMAFVLPFEDAMRLNATSVRLQFAYTDENGIPDAIDPVTVPVGELLNEAGYNPGGE